MAEVRTELLALADVEEMDEAQSVRFTELETEYAGLEAEESPLAERAEKIEKIRKAAEKDSNRHGPQVVVRTKTNPYEGLESLRTHVDPRDREGISALRSRALYAVEQAPEHMSDASRAKVEKLVRGEKRGTLARHILLSGSPDYHRAFESLLTHNSPMLLDEAEARAYRAAALTLTDANGGYLVPFTLDPTIVLTNDGTANPWRAAATVKTITTDTWNGVNSAGVSAEWLAEATEAAEAGPTFSNVVITPGKAAALITGSFEVLADSGFASDVAPLLSDAKDRLEAAAFALGTGSGRPHGVIDALVDASKTVASATTDTFAIADVYATQVAVPPRHRSRAVWFANAAIMAKIRQFDTSGGGGFWANLGSAVPEELLGRPIYESSDMDGAIDAAAENYVLASVDMSHYYVVDRVGMTVIYEPLVVGANQKPTGQAAWFAYWRVGGDLVSTNAGRVLNVT